MAAAAARIEKPRPDRPNVMAQTGPVIAYANLGAVSTRSLALIGTPASFMRR